jgi:ABC-type sugar transport system ATPase subunit
VDACMNHDVMIEVRGLGKRFPGVTALQDVSFDIKKNTVHCIVGENGAGKSTFIKILSGAIAKTEGHIRFKGQPFDPKKVRDAMAGGLSVLYQELNVVDDLTVEENLILGKENHRFGFILKNRLAAETETVLKGFDSTIHLHMRVGDLSVAQKQVIEITKALSADCSVLIMDEPTASLSEEETRRLFATIRKLKKKGITIIYISHKLGEIFEIGDYVTVFRDGQMVGTEPVSRLTTTDLVKLMLGKVLAETYIASRTDYAVKLLEVKNITNRKLRNVSFDLYKREILGFYGLVGAGKTEVARVLYGIDEYQGKTLIHGEQSEFHDVRGALKAGLAMVPEERREDGIFGKLSIRANIPMMKLANVLKYGMINRRKENDLADEYLKRMSIVAIDREQKVSFLSGGNQQKVVISKCLNRQSDILLMDEPTRGVDVGAKSEIHNIIRALANEGKGIIVFSSELQEILQLCDRIVLMKEGRIREILKNSDDISADHIVAIVAGEEA